MGLSNESGDFAFVDLDARLQLICPHCRRLGLGVIREDGEIVYEQIDEERKMPNGEGVSPWDGIVSQIISERANQIEQWGNDHDDKHTPLDWVGLVAHFSSRWLKFKFNPVLFRNCMIKTPRQFVSLP